MELTDSATIVCVDDEPSVLKTLENSLHPQGYRVVTCSHPEQALQVIQENSAALIILDIRMPGMDGFALYKQLRDYKHIPVLFLTGYSRSFTAKSDEVMELWQQEFSEGTTDIMYKPFELDELYEKVEGLIGPGMDPDESEK